MKFLAAILALSMFATVPALADSTTVNVETGARSGHHNFAPGVRSYLELQKREKLRRKYMKHQERAEKREMRYRARLAKKAARMQGLRAPQPQEPLK